MKEFDMKNQRKLSLYANTQLLKEKERKLLLLKVNKVGFNETKSSTPFMRTFECVLKSRTCLPQHVYVFLNSCTCIIYECGKSKGT